MIEGAALTGDYTLFEDADFDVMTTLLDSEDGWDLLNDGQVKVWRKPDPNNAALIILRCALTVSNVDPNDLMAVWRDIDYRFAWDDRCVINTCTQIIGEGENINEVGYYEGKAPPTITNRDFVLQTGWRYNYKGLKQHLYMNKSVEHPAHPVDKSKVRAISHLTGIRVLFGQQDNKVALNYVTNGDICGSIPKRLINWAATKAAPGMMTQIVDAARGYQAWRKENPKRDDEPLHYAAAGK